MRRKSLAKRRFNYKCSAPSQATGRTASLAPGFVFWQTGPTRQRDDPGEHKAWPVALEVRLAPAPSDSSASHSGPKSLTGPRWSSGLASRRSSAHAVKLSAGRAVLGKARLIRIGHADSWGLSDRSMLAVRVDPARPRPERGLRQTAPCARSRQARRRPAMARRAGR